jgi:hypothetical protein
MIMPRYEGINRNYEAGVWNKDEGPSEEEKKAERERLMKEFLAKGGKVEKLAPGNAKVYGTLSRGGKPPFTDAELKAKWKAENGSGDTQETSGTEQPTE